MQLFRNMLILSIPVFFLLPMFASEALSQPKCPRGLFMNLTGTTCTVWKAKDMEVIRDVKISDLRIRHSRVVGGKYFLDCDRGHQDIVEVDGPFNAFTSNALDRILSGIEPCEIGGSTDRPWVWLSSGGGRLIDGMKVGETIRKLGFGTAIPLDAQCSSSCAIAFLGGEYRYVFDSAELLLHAPFFLPEGKRIDAEVRARWAARLGINCVTEMSDLKNYFATMLPQETALFLYEQTMGFCSTNSGWTFNRDAAQLYEMDNFDGYVEPLAEYLSKQ